MMTMEGHLLQTTAQHRLTTKIHGMLNLNTLILAMENFLLLGNIYKWELWFYMIVSNNHVKTSIQV